MSFWYCSYTMMTYLSKQIEMQLSDNVTKDDLLIIVSKIKF